jgi:CheY-like chemotaxis protein
MESERSRSKKRVRSSKGALKELYMNSESLNLNNIAIDGAGWPIALPAAPDRERERKRESPRVLLVDDDPIFCRRLARAAKQNHIPLSTCSSTQEMEAIRQYSMYDVALIDYYLGDCTAPEIIPMFKGKVPVILISENGSAGLADAPWPAPVKRFVSKSEGVQVILEEALRVINLQSVYESGVGLEGAPEPYISRINLLWTLGAAVVCIVCSVFLLAVSGLLNPHPITFKAMRSTISPINGIKLDPVPMDRIRAPIKWDQVPVNKRVDFG